jgi:hypothetical protein
MKIETFALPDTRRYGTAASYKLVGVRLEIYNAEYDDVINRLACEASKRPDSYMFWLDGTVPGLRVFHDASTGQVVFGFGRRSDNAPTADETKEAVLDALRGLRETIVGKAMCQKKRKALLAKVGDLTEALEGRLDGEAEKFGRPFTPVQSEVYVALLDEINRLEDEQSAAENTELNARCRKKCEATAEYKRKIDLITEQRHAAVRAINAESSKNITAIRREYGKKIDELKSQLAEAV